MAKPDSLTRVKYCTVHLFLLMNLYGSRHFQGYERMFFSICSQCCHHRYTIPNQKTQKLGEKHLFFLALEGKTLQKVLHSDEA